MVKGNNTQHIVLVYVFAHKILCMDVSGKGQFSG